MEEEGWGVSEDEDGGLQQVVKEEIGTNRSGGDGTREQIQLPRYSHHHHNSSIHAVITQKDTSSVEGEIKGSQKVLKRPDSTQ
jgi:hypothetical protein